MSVSINGSAGVTVNSGAVLGITSGTAVASTSGTSIDFTSIPSWVKRITVMFNGVSTNSTSGIIVQVGSGSVTSSGYGSGFTYTSAAASATGTLSNGFLAYVNGNAAATFSGSLVLTNISGNIWVASSVCAASNVNTTTFGGGTITLSGVLDRVRTTTQSGTDTFDAGSINILYE